MRFRNTLLVALLAVVLGGYLWWSERAARQREAQETAATLLVPVDPDTLQALTFNHSGKQFHLERRPSGWVVVRPVTAPCDPQAIRAFLDTLRLARKEEDVGKGNLVRYGLDHPAAEVFITVRGRQEPSWRLRFGRINPLQTLVYVLVNDDEHVYLTTSSLLTQSLNRAFGWRDKRVIDVDPARVHRMRFHTLAAGSLAVHRDERAGWVREGGMPFRADPVRTRGLLLGLARLKAVGVAAEAKEDLHKYGLDNKRFAAYLEDAQGRILAELVLGWARSEGSVYAIVPDKPEIWRIDGKLAEQITAFAHDPRDRKLFPPFDPGHVRRLEVVSPTDSFAVERVSVSTWKTLYSRNHGAEFALDPGKVVAAIEELAALQVADFPKSPPPRSVYDPPSVRVVLHDDRGGVVGIEVGRKDPGGLYTFARGLGEPAVFLVAPTALIGLPFDLERLGVEGKEAPAASDRG